MYLNNEVLQIKFYQWKNDKLKDSMQLNIKHLYV